MFPLLHSVSQHREECGVDVKLLHITENRLLQGNSLFRHTVGKFCGDILISQVREMAVVKRHILHVAVLTTADFRHSCRKCVDSAEIYIPYSGAKVMLLYLDADGVLIATVNGDIGKADVFDQRSLKALVAHTCLCRV